MRPLIPLEGTTVSYQPPSLHDFRFGGIYGGPDWLNRPLVQAVAAAIIVIAFWLWASRQLKTVPTRRQFVFEYFYEFIRNGVARDALGHDFRKYVPYLLGLFSFIWVNNVFEIFFLTMFPTMANIGYAWALAIIAWIVYNWAGIRRHGVGGYLRRSLFPSGVPAPLYLLVTPIEFMSNILIRPLTLGLRLFGNMFAGHLVVLVFVVGGSYLMLHGSQPVYHVAGVVSLLFSFVIFALELLVCTLQAYIFTVLTAQYVASSIADEH